MKKALLAIVALVMFASLSFAQSSAFDEGVFTVNVIQKLTCVADGDISIKVAQNATHAGPWIITFNMTGDAATDVVYSATVVDAGSSTITLQPSGEDAMNGWSSLATATLAVKSAITYTLTSVTASATAAVGDSKTRTATLNAAYSY